MLVGGAALLLLVGSLGERVTLLACAGVVALSSLGAFASSGVATSSDSADDPASAPRKDTPLGIRRLAKHALTKEARAVLLVALTFKLGLHMAGSLFKPMTVDYGWTKQQIGAAVVSVGSGSALLGAAAGGLLHRLVHEKRALIFALFVQALVCAPFVVVDQLHAPLKLTTGTIALEHFGTGLGTTVLFAALMTATRPADAGLHYTVLQSANALGIGVGSLFGGLLADHVGKSATFVIATFVCLAPGVLLLRWDEAALASRS
jgi:predicted MFS family arabinose efflux permease